jgi:hypothetical protein
MRISWKLPDVEYWPALAQRTLANTKPNERGCMEFQGYRVPKKGYGQVGIKPSEGRTQANEHAHRVVYRGIRGPIPHTWDVCHTCDNPPCVNPLHLFAAPRVANLIDMRNKGRNRQTQKTHCPQGHSYAEHGIPKPGKPTWRLCAVCEETRQASPKYRAQRAEYHRLKRLRNKAPAVGKSE